jgi:hypothetical protein
MKNLTQEIFSSRKARVKRLDEIKEETNGMRGKAQDLVRQFQTSRRQESTRLRTVLAQGRAERESETREMLKDFQGSRKETAAQIHKQLANTRQAKRARVEVPPKAEAPGAEEELAKTPFVENEAPDLEAKFLAAIIEHPRGITLAKVADSLGVAPIVLARAVKNLVNNGKIRKEEKFYFPIDNE